MFKGWMLCFIYMDIVVMVSSCFRRNKKVGRLRFESVN